MHRIMKKLAAALLILSTAAFAQVGIVRSTGGIHAPSAKTLPQGFLYVSSSFEMVNDGKAPSIEGYYTDENGTPYQLDKDTPSNDDNLFLSFGILDVLQLGITVPLHYDGNIRGKGKSLKGIALGDLQFLVKGYIPINEWLHAGLSGELFAPTGSKEKGFRPRHRWYVRPDGKTYAYTANEWAAEGNAHITIDFSKYVVFNSYLGILKKLKNNENYMLWGGGIDIFPEMRLTLVLETSGEIPLYSTNPQRSFWSNPIRITSGLKLHLPYESFVTISGDVGFNQFRKQDVSEGLPVELQSAATPLYFTQASTPNLTVAVTFSKVFDLSWADNDQDGIINRKDMCPNTGDRLKVNERGCPVDEDQDGVLNIVDLCPETPAGFPVDYNGCPPDGDRDGIPDYLDQCPDTREGFAVDSTGCMLDTDGDGIDNNNDKCPKTPSHEKIGEDGCPLDQDHDGITNDIDQCPGTPEGISIDLFGCPLDFDGDGIPDEMDRCPNTILGEKVDPLGCPLDSDKDGVPDSRDQCPDTPEGTAVNVQGCRIDQDNDGIFDEDDRCPGTPEGAPTDSLGCPLDSDHDGIADWADLCPGTFDNVSVNDMGCPTNIKLNFNHIAMRIRFKGADSTLLNSSYTALNDIVYIMRQHPMKLEIQCSADIAADRALEVSSRRAEAIYNYLVYKGISEKRLKFRGFGKKLPPSLTQKYGHSESIRLIPSPELTK